MSVTPSLACLPEDGYTLNRAAVALLVDRAVEMGADAISLGVSEPDPQMAAFLAAQMPGQDFQAWRQVVAHLSVDLETLAQLQAPPPSLARLLTRCRDLLSQMRQGDAYALTGDLHAAEHLVAEVDAVLARP